MNWLNKLEQKCKGRSIPNITRIFIAANVIGTLIFMGNSFIASYFLRFDAALILKGELWRLFTWIFVPSASMSFWGILFIVCLWMLGNSLESMLGSFRMNVYFLGGFLLSDIVGMLIYVFAQIPIQLTMYYILISMYLMLGLMIPEAEVRLYFVLPIKMKWMVIVYFIMFAYDVYTYFSFGVMVGIAYGTEIVLALANLIIFVYSCKNKMSFKQNMKQKKKRNEFRNEFAKPRPGSGITQHKCCICGRTEQSNPELMFRYCSKCTGSKEYCSDHLFTHEHV